MPYIVIKDFKDLEDKNHIYRAGDKYPRSGRGKKERLEELLSSDNLRGEPLIEEVGD
ncbi:hypothetical protein JNUCC31_25105 [Paenibacillus sp. JNUCC31]|uniref:hypothetical protein n=1 Tax=Paenibacillus sp. JNUCC-31 TaxID=2777983 RepID=UPI0017854AA3|nr:hypothetical protein [Paenibacillus sp. JNUCC-31]QOS77945.1 hypothetical protein JNUCC31_24865 [Paenibacillus sp. JNUCC-31]QOS77988.1 hypothetical protein JNUCC31_25105 [Paenibacillus sp. JNUCC-31]